MTVRRWLVVIVVIALSLATSRARILWERAAFCRECAAHLSARAREYRKEAQLGRQELAKLGNERYPSDEFVASLTGAERDRLDRKWERINLIMAEASFDTRYDDSLASECDLLSSRWLDASNRPWQSLPADLSPEPKPRGCMFGCSFGGVPRPAEVIWLEANRW
jgi:hypothetical protein